MTTHAGLSFDRHQFQSRPTPVSADTRISYDDYRSMHISKPTGTGERRLPTPVWSVNDAQLREVLVHFIERRAGFRKPQVGTLEERLASAQKMIAANLPRLIAALDRSCIRLMELKRTGAARTEVKKLEELIENMDTTVRTAKHGFADKVIGIVHLYYRCGMNSAQVGAELGLKPPHVRMILWRLHRVFDVMQSTRMQD